MAWLQIHQTLKDHRKLLSAADMLDITPPYMMGLLVSFWLWSLDNAPNGKLNGISLKIIARAAQWKGDPNRFIEALKSTGWLDETAQGIEIHDWHEYAGKLIDKRIDERARSRKRRLLPTISDNQPTNDQRSTVGRPTVDQQTSNKRPTVDQRQSRVDQTRVDQTRIKDTMCSTLNETQTTLDIHVAESEFNATNTDADSNPDKENKKNYAPLVLMTEKEHQKLIEKFGQVATEEKIEKLSLYKKSTGKQYKCDYSTILVWARKDEPKEAPIEKPGKYAHLYNR